METVAKLTDERKPGIVRILWKLNETVVFHVETSNFLDDVSRSLLFFFYVRQKRCKMDCFEVAMCLLYHTAVCIVVGQVQL